MASSSKTVFKLEVLKAKALESVDQRSALVESELAELEDPETLRLRVQDWRSQQEARLSDIFRQLDTIDSESLADFKLAPIPRKDVHQIDALNRELRRLRGSRAKILAKADSLVADEQGNIALTRVQLSEFFDL